MPYPAWDLIVAKSHRFDYWTVNAVFGVCQWAANSGSNYVKSTASVEIHGRTPLSYAVERGNEEVVKLLLGHPGVEADSKDIYGRTPLSYAAEEGNEEVVKLLLGRPGVEADSKDVYGGSPLSYAAGCLRSSHSTSYPQATSTADTTVGPPTPQYL
jgi:hypothetical protein